MSSFYKQALDFGKLILTHNFSPHNSVLGNNKVIIINKKWLFKLHWCDISVFFSDDLLDENGKLLSHDKFIGKYKTGISCNQYYKVCKAIPIMLSSNPETLDHLFFNISMLMPSGIKSTDGFHSKFPMYLLLHIRMFFI